MDHAARISRATLLALGVGLAFVAAGVVMVVVGWPESTPVQRACMQLSGIMFALAVATAIWRMVAEQELLRHPTPSFRRVRLVTVVAVSVGVVLHVVALVAHQQSFTPLAQLAIWIGLFAMFAYLAAGATRRELAERTTWTQIEAEHDGADEDADDGMDLDAPDPDVLLGWQPREPHRG